MWSYYNLIPSTQWVHDRDLVLCYDILQYANSCYIVEAINIRRLHKSMWGPDFHWVPISTIIASIKVSN